MTLIVDSNPYLPIESVALQTLQALCFKQGNKTDKKL
jgi:hypothetical protein